MILPYSLNSIALISTPLTSLYKQTCFEALAPLGAGTLCTKLETKVSTWSRQVVLTMQTPGVSNHCKKKLSHEKVLSVYIYSSTLKLHASNNLMTSELETESPENQLTPTHR